MALALAALMLAGLAPAARATPGVLLVGDSLQELSSPYLAKYLPGVPLTINAVGGSNSFQVYDLFEQSYDPAQHRVIVFDGGTNDNPNYPEILAGNLAKVAATVGDRCMVVPTVHGYTVEGADNTGKNQVVREFAAARPGTQTPDWEGAVLRHPELMQADNLHPIEAGSDLRARLIAAGVMACLAYESGATETASASSRPALAEAPATIPPVGAMQRREAELSRAIGAEVLRQTAARTLASVL